MSENNENKFEKFTDNSFLILLSLVNAKHGYSIMKTITKITDGQISIGAASLYTNLKKLVTEGLIEQIDEEDLNKKTYIITKEGYDSLNREYKRRKEMLQYAYQTLHIEGGEQNE